MIRLRNGSRVSVPSMGTPLARPSASRGPRSVVLPSRRWRRIDPARASGGNATPRAVEVLLVAVGGAGVEAAVADQGSVGIEQAVAVRAEVAGRRRRRHALER